MKRNKHILVTFTAAVLALCGCDDLKNTRIDVDMGSQGISFVLGTAVSGTGAAGSQISAMYRLDLSNQIFDELRQHIDDPLEFYTTGLICKFTPAAGYGNISITSFKATADGVKPDYKLSVPPVGEEFTDNELTAFINSALTRVVSTKELNITITGQTDAPVGSELGTLEINFDLRAKVYPLNQRE